MIKVNPWAAVRYVSDNYEARENTAEPLQLRVKVCPACGHDKWAVAFHGERQIFHGFCCDANVAFLDQVRGDLGGVSLSAALRALSKYGESKFLLDLTRRYEGTSEEPSRLAFLRERLSVANTPCFMPDASSTGLDLSLWQRVIYTGAGAKFLNYALSRNVPEWFIESGRLGWFDPPHPLSGRLSFLIFRGGVPVYAVGRGITPDAFPKYLTLSESFAGVGASGVVFNLDLIPPGKIILVCEGVLSALSAPHGVATLGKTLSDSQAWQIAQAAPSAVVLLREEGVPPILIEDNASRLRAHGLLTFHAALLRGDTNDDPDQLPEVLELAEMTGLRSQIGARLFLNS